jgi:hypothetical protein
MARKKIDFNQFIEMNDTNGSTLGTIRTKSVRQSYVAFY